MLKRFIIVFLAFLFFVRIVERSGRLSIHVGQQQAWASRDSLLGDTTIIKKNKPVLLRYGARIISDSSGTNAGLGRSIGDPTHRLEVHADSLTANYFSSVAGAVDSNDIKTPGISKGNLAGLIVDSSKVQARGLGRSNHQLSSIDSTLLLTGGSGSGFLTSTISKSITWTAAQTVTGTANGGQETFQSSGNNGGIILNNTGTNGTPWYLNSTNSGAVAGAGKFTIAFRNGTPYMVVDSTGAVGVGTNTPLAGYEDVGINLRVSASTSPIFRIFQTAGKKQDFTMQFATGVNSSMIFGHNSAGFFGVDSVGHFAIDRNSGAQNHMANDFNVYNNATGSYITAGDLAFTAASDSTLKKDICCIKPEEMSVDVLALQKSLPVTSYKWNEAIYPDSTQKKMVARDPEMFIRKHYGPMAQEWYKVASAMGWEADDKHISGQQMMMFQSLVSQKLIEENEGLRAWNLKMQSQIDSLISVKH